MEKSVNVDEAELRKFSSAAHRWWDESGEFSALHAINPLRLAWIDALAGGLRDKKVLDVGCGGGLLSEAMARCGARVMGIDLSEKSLQVARLHALESQVSQLDYRHVSAEDLATEQPGSFDVVTCLEMLEHVPAPASIVQACSQLVKPGGWVFFSTLNRNPKSFLMAIVGAEYILGLVPRGTHEYLRFIRPSELAAWCRQADLSVCGISGLSYDPFSRRYRLGTRPDVNYLLASQRAWAESLVRVQGAQGERS